MNKLKYIPALILTLVAIMYFVLLSPSPITKYDPEYIQYYNALNFIDHLKFKEMYSPGVTNGLAVSLVLSLIYFFSNSTDKASFFSENSETLLVACGWIFLIMVVSIFIYFNYVLRKLTLKELLLIFSPLLITFTIIQASGMVAPRPFIIIFSLLYILHRYMRPESQSYLFLFGTMMLLTKITTAPYILVPLLFFKLKKSLKLGFLIISTFILIVILTVDDYSGVQLFIQGFLQHSGGYGSSQHFIDFSSFINNFEFLVIRNPIIFLLWIFLTTFFLINRKKIPIPIQQEFTLLIVADLIFIFFVCRHVGRSYYLIPFILFLVPRVFMLKEELLSFIGRNIRWFFGVSVLCIVTFAIMAVSRVKLIKRMKPGKIDVHVLELYNTENPNHKINDGFPTVTFAKWFGRKSNGME